MSLMEHIKRNDARYGKSVMQRKQQEAYEAEQERKTEGEEERNITQKLVWGVWTFSQKRYRVYTGDFSDTWSITRRLGGGTEVKLGDFEYREDWGDYARTGISFGSSIEHLIYRKSSQTRLPLHGEGNEYGYSPKWNLTIPYKLIADARELSQLKRGLGIFPTEF